MTRSSVLIILLLIYSTFAGFQWQLSIAIYVVAALTFLQLNLTRLQWCLLLLLMAGGIWAFISTGEDLFLGAVLAHAGGLAILKDKEPKKVGRAFISFLLAVLVVTSVVVVVNGDFTRHQPPFTGINRIIFLLLSVYAISEYLRGDWWLKSIRTLGAIAVVLLGVSMGARFLVLGGMALLVADGLTEFRVPRAGILVCVAAVVALLVSSGITNTTKLEGLSFLEKSAEENNQLQRLQTIKDVDEEPRLILWKEYLSGQSQVFEQYNQNMHNMILQALVTGGAVTALPVFLWFTFLLVMAARDFWLQRYVCSALYALVALKMNIDRSFYAGPEVMIVYITYFSTMAKQANLGLYKLRTFIVSPDTGTVPKQSIASVTRK